MTNHFGSYLQILVAEYTLLLMAGDTQLIMAMAMKRQWNGVETNVNMRQMEFSNINSCISWDCCNVITTSFMKKFLMKV